MNMGPDDLLLIVMLTALTLYAILGGADFGAGVWEFTTALQSSEKNAGTSTRPSAQFGKRTTSG